MKDENLVILLGGGLAAGKTTFTKGIAKGLGINEIIKSPTFTIMKTYEGKYNKLFHLDLYRLTKTGMGFDLEDYILNEDDYIKKTKRLIESIPKETKIVVMSHTPFKEYSVSDNKNIGVPSNWIFKDYPNVKVYIHGHGHSKYKEEVIEGVLCITNPIVMNTSYLEKSYSLNEWHDILKRY